MRRKKRILLTNDDGIEAESIWALKEVLSGIADCEIVAPRHPKSASSHAVSLNHNIRLHRIRRGKHKGYGVDGTPVDSIKFALNVLFSNRPFDLIVSGINLGPNTGVSVYYSGTIAAAREGIICGVPAFAVSIDSFVWNGFSYALEITKQIAVRYLCSGFPADYFLNVNIPAVEHARHIRGFRMTRQAPSKFVELFDREDAPGELSYRLRGKIVVLNPDGETDQEALEKKYVSITPLALDMTHYGHMKHTKTLLKDLQGKIRRRG